MLYSESIMSEKSKFLLRNGEAIWYSWFKYPDGARWIVRWQGRYFSIVHDGTGNQFYHSHEPEEISEEEAKEILSKYKEAWKDAVELWGWESLDEYFAKTL
jgi:hypothetical protein